VPADTIRNRSPAARVWREAVAQAGTEVKIQDPLLTPLFIEIVVCDW